MTGERRGASALIVAAGTGVGLVAFRRRLLSQRAMEPTGLPVDPEPASGGEGHASADEQLEAAGALAGAEERVSAR